MNLPEISLKKLSPLAMIPTRAHETDVGYDLYACLWEETQLATGFSRQYWTSLVHAKGFLLMPRKTLVVPLGFCVEIPPDWEIQVRSRSGMATQGVFVVNSPGTVDPGYRGEMGVILHNASDETFRVRHGDRVAQAIIAPRYSAVFREVEELGTSLRGAGGFGSTGKV